jgi:hypothetical protein
MSPVLMDKPQRLAHMILLAQDHLAQRPDFDFMEGALLVPELAMLGRSLTEIQSLGAEATKKLRSLSGLDDDMVASTIYELLVGAAAVRKGRELQMLEPESTKTPDFRVMNSPVPTVIECKRRLGLSDYEVAEGQAAMGLFAQGFHSLLRNGVPFAAEVAFSVEVTSIDPKTFQSVVERIAPIASKEVAIATESWGELRLSPAPSRIAIGRTRMNSPIYLEQGFGWSSQPLQWDGIIVEAEYPAQVVVDAVSLPQSMKWRSRSALAQTKKSRHITSLWGKAVKQIPIGEVGVIYIAYPEGNADDLADKRTTDILESSKTLFHGMEIQVGLLCVNRIYPCSRDHGRPDLIDSTLVFDTDGDYRNSYPTVIMTPRA